MVQLYIPLFGALYGCANGVPNFTRLRLWGSAAAAALPWLGVSSRASRVTGWLGWPPGSGSAAAAAVSSRVQLAVHSMVQQAQSRGILDSEHCEKAEWVAVRLGFLENFSESNPSAQSGNTTLHESALGRGTVMIVAPAGDPSSIKFDSNDSQHPRWCETVSCLSPWHGHGIRLYRIQWPVTAVGPSYCVENWAWARPAARPPQGSAGRRACAEFWLDEAWQCCRPV